MTQKRIIGIFTGNRSEYGLLFPVISAIAAHPELDYRLVVSGAHLDKNFGGTIQEIEHDGFHVDAEAKIEMQGDNLYATTSAIGHTIVSICNILEKLRPDIWVVYGDRFEAFAAAIASTQMCIPTAHIEGGDITEGGALDDSVRHAITKLAHLHFTTNELASDRVRSMGEEPWRVKTVGFPSIDLIHAKDYATPTELTTRYSLDLTRPIVLFTQHSVAAQYEQASSQIRPSLDALEVIAREGIQVIITYPNNDAGGKVLIREIENFTSRKIPGIQAHVSLGRRNYHGMLNLLGRNGKIGGVCVGNSSSGIKETPAFGCPSINIGTRQDGRLAADNMINVSYDKDQILAAINRSLNDRDFIKQCHDCSNPYGTGDCGRNIADALALVPLDSRIIIKRMTI